MKIINIITILYITVTQSSYFEEAKNNVGDTEAIMQVVFAENNSAVSQNEIQSAHWTHPQITIFTCFASLKGLTPLMLASCNGHRTIVEILIEYGSDANVTDICGRTALDLATLCCREDVIIFLKNVTQETEKASKGEIKNEYPNSNYLLRNGDIHKNDGMPHHQVGGIKRGTDELLSQSGGAVSNGSAMSPESHDNENNNDAKKVKLDKAQTGKPSRVVHIRNVSSDAAETDIIYLGVAFGRVTNVLLLKGKNQAFLEMADEASAVAMVNYYANSGAPFVRGRNVYVQYSNHKELKTENSHVTGNSSTQAALQAAQALVNHTSSDTQGGPNTVLRVIVDNQIYPVSLEILYQIFSRVGRVLKIVTFNKNGTFQALIQYPDVITAQAAKLSLDGQNIYNSCCTLRVEYSKLSNLNVKYNNDKSRDFTNPTLPIGDPTLENIGLSGSMGVLASPFAAPGLGSPLTAAYAAGAGALPLGSFALSPAATTAAALGVAGLRLPGQHLSTVLLVSNLNEEKVTPDALFTLFGVYGDVQRVKILFNKKDNALIQMAEPQQAQLALTHLDKIKVYGKPIRVAPSRHQFVQMPKDGQPDAGLTKDYSNSPLHRFKKPGSKNYQNIYAPSATLHLSNIPPSVTEEQIKEAFSQTGGTVVAFKFFPKDRKMALIQMDSVDEAVIALIKMHNYQLSDSSHLRVSFSKSTI